jgi:hypothetical protein
MPAMLDAKQLEKLSGTYDTDYKKWLKSIKQN